MRYAALFSSLTLVALLSGCSPEQLDPTVQAGAPALLAKVMPAGFTRIILSANDRGTNRQHCFVLMDAAAAKQWNGTVYDQGTFSQSADVGSRHESDAIMLNASLKDNRWTIEQSDIDPASMPADVVESTVRECVTALAQQANAKYDNGVTRAGIIEHNMQTWMTAIDDALAPKQPNR